MLDIWLVYKYKCRSQVTTRRRHGAIEVNNQDKVYATNTGGNKSYAIHPWYRNTGQAIRRYPRTNYRRFEPQEQWGGTEAIAYRQYMVRFAALRLSCFGKLFLLNHFDATH